MLSVGPVGDRQPGLRRARGIVGIIPVVSLTGGDALAEIGEIVDRISDLPVEMIAVAPIAERPVNVDTDEIDQCRRPERIERKAHLRATGKNMRAIFGPVGRIGQFRGRADDRLYVRSKHFQRIDGGIDA